MLWQSHSVNTCTKSCTTPLVARRIIAAAIVQCQRALTLQTLQNNVLKLFRKISYSLFCNNSPYFWLWELVSQYFCVVCLVPLLSGKKLLVVERSAGVAPEHKQKVRLGQNMTLELFL